MSIQPVPSAVNSVVLQKSTTQKTSSQESSTATAVSASQDTLTIGNSDLSSKYVTYTLNGTIAGTNSDTASAADVAKSADTSSGTDSTELTDDNNYKAIVSRYKGAMTLDNYCDMLCELANTSLITVDEMNKAAGEAMFKLDCDNLQVDMKDGIIGNLPESLRSSHVDFTELLAGLDDDNRSYSYDPTNEQAFLKSFYSKMINYTQS